jgi:hypothetical protein
VGIVNLVEKAVKHGGKLVPLVIPNGLTSGTGLMNPSIFVDDEGDILVNLRHVNYTLYHAEGEQKFPSRWGPLGYLHPEKDQRLVTENYLCRLDKDLAISEFTKVEMLELHEPVWEFVGLEDARLLQWDNEYCLIGVRRDTTDNGVGRMEKTVIELDKKTWSAKETKRTRIPAPAPDNSYCEKNWVPILDRVDHFIKWTSPVEVVKLDGKECSQIALKQGIVSNKDQRGGSQLIRWGNIYISITHEVDLYNNYLNQKDGLYRHRLCVWDDQLNLVGLGDTFSFLDGKIEFCVGAAIYKDDLLISFGFQDNAAFVLRTPKGVVEDMIVQALDAH